jgi:hypothetical protein
MAVLEFDTRTIQILDPHPWLPHMVHRFCILQLRALLAGERRWTFENVSDFPVELGTERVTRQFIIEFGAATKTHVGRLKDDTKVFCIFWDSSSAAADVRLATLALLRKWTGELTLESVQSKSLRITALVDHHPARSPSPKERQLIFDLLAGEVDASTVLGKLRINFPYVAAFEWPAVEGRDDLGRGDLVMTNGYGIFVVIECKYIDKETGKTARQRRRNQRNMVKEQAADYRDLYQRLKPDAVVLACSYTNEGLLFMDKDGASFCQFGAAVSSKESRLSPEYVVQLKSNAAAERAVAEQKRISSMQLLEKQNMEYRQRLSEEQQRLDMLRGQIVHESLANERLRELLKQAKKVGCCRSIVIVIGTTITIILSFLILIVEVAR